MFISRSREPGNEARPIELIHSQISTQLYLQLQRVLFLAQMRNNICMTHECNGIQYDAIPTVVHGSLVAAVYNTWSGYEARPWLLMFHY